MKDNPRTYTIRNLTEEEARKTLSEIPKEELIEMLIISNRALDNALSFANGHSVDFREMEPTPPQTPNTFWTDRTYFDCLGCPLHLKGCGGESTITTAGSLPQSSILKD